jgi:hypothetical protein
MFACVDLTSPHLSECNYSWDHVTKICNTQMEFNLGFCSSGYEAYSLLGCNVELAGRRLLMVQRSVLPPFSGLNSEVFKQAAGRVMPVH